MTPAEARAWIAGLEVLGMRFGLERMGALLAALGRPQEGPPALHVVGTNGKSSTSRLAAAALAGEGLTVGTYLSPHVVDWTERIQVGGDPVGEDAFAAAVGTVRAAAERLPLEGGDRVTQFEALTAAAFVAFRRAGVAAMVVEAGLGGRYDATNVLGPEAVVTLTNVALEHTELLGETEAAIAAEKLAVCPDGSGRLVVGPLSPAAERAVAGEMAARGLTGWRVGREIQVRHGDAGVAVATPTGAYGLLPLGLAGRFQEDNVAAAVGAAEMLLGRRLDPARLAAALAGVRIPGRLEVVAGAPLTVLDGAHNPAGMAALAQSLPAVVGDRTPVVAVLSLLDDKDAVAMLDALAPAAGTVVATRSRHARAADPGRLAEIARRRGLRATAEEPPVAAVARARRAAGEGGAVVVCGSLYLLGDLRPALLAEAGESPATLAPLRARPPAIGDA